MKILKSRFLHEKNSFWSGFFLLVRLGVYFAIMKLTSVDGEYYLSAAKSRLKVYTNNLFVRKLLIWNNPDTFIMVRLTSNLV